MVRLRHRYLVTEYNIAEDRETASSSSSAPSIRSSSFLQSINHAIKHLHGVQGIALSKAGLLVKYINNSTTMLFIRMRRSAYRIVTSALPFVRQVEGKSLSLRTLYTGATIRHCNLFLVKYQRRKLEEQYGSLKSDLQRQLFNREVANIRQYSVQMGP